MPGVAFPTWGSSARAELLWLPRRFPLTPQIRLLPRPPSTFLYVLVYRYVFALFPTPKLTNVQHQLIVYKTMTSTD